jgi:hypothetical protein
MMQQSKFILLIPIAVFVLGCGKNEKPGPASPPPADKAKSQSPQNVTQTPAGAAPVAPTAAKIVPLDLAPGGLFLTMNAPEGARVFPAGSGANVEKGEEFRLWIMPDKDDTSSLLYKEIRAVMGQQPEVIEDRDGVLVGGTRALGEEDFRCLVKITVAGQVYVCVARREAGTSAFSRRQAIRMAECAKSLTQTDANKQAAKRMEQAVAQFRRVDCSWGAFNKLELEGDEVSDADLALVKDLPQTETVYFSATKVTPAGLKHLNGLPNLRWVTLTGETATDARLAAIHPPRLRSLLLTETKITGTGLAHVAALKSLEQLYIRDQPIADADLKLLGALPQLEHLELSTTGTSDTGLKHIATLKKLTWLEIVDNPVTDTGLNHLVGLKELGMLKLTQTKVTKAGAQKLKQALPRCDIEVK